MKTLFQDSAILTIRLNLYGKHNMVYGKHNNIP